ncbi:MAG TPA: DUF4386 domain-containing protein [Thermoanaerobaculia bacterium]|nr:DUF4386 domain-containing protein [Thermoanaerobaculia bacterium]
MSTAITIEPPSERPLLQARLAGLFYLTTMVAGIFALFVVGSRLVVPGDAAATASNVLANESLFRLGFAAELISIAAYVAVVSVLYGLLRPVSRGLSFMAALFGLMGNAVLAVNSLNLIVPMFLLRRPESLSGFSAEQVQSLALTLIRVHDSLGFNISIVFFGFYCVLIGSLIFRSTFLPRVIGLLMLLGGLGWLIHSFTGFLSPARSSELYPYSLIPGTVGEAALTLWLIVFGVNVHRWREQSGVVNDAPNRKAENA